jgi:hypothetical protein
MLLQIKDPNLAQSFPLSRDPSFSASGSIDPNLFKQSQEVKKDQLADKLLKFGKFTQPNQSDYFYQRALSKSQSISHCSVSEKYIAYILLTNYDEHKMDMFQIDEKEVTKHTEIVVIDVTDMSEVKIKSPSPDLISALYIDQEIMMIGSRAKIYEVKPQALFIQTTSSADTTLLKTDSGMS